MKRSCFSPSRQDGSHHVVTAHIPGVATGEQVVSMPTDGDHSTPLVVPDHLFPDDGKSDIVDVLFAVEFNLPDVEAHHCKDNRRNALYV